MGLSKEDIACPSIAKVINMKFRTDHALTILVGAVFVFAIVWSQDWPGQSRLFTRAIAIPGLLLALFHLVHETIRTPKPSDITFLSYSDIPADRTIPRQVMRRRTLNIFGWIFSLFLLIWLVNFKIAVPLFVFLYLKFQARESLIISFMLAAVMVILIVGVFGFILHVPWPDGVIQDWFGW